MTVKPRPYDVAIVGGGIIGLATALAFSTRSPRLRLIILEKEHALGMHQTGRNSGVIHTGIYYPPGSLKAQFCVEGARRLRRFCAEHGIRTETRGKVIVATTPDELAGVDELLRRGRANNVEGLERIGPERLRELEPYAAGIAALYVPAAAVVDFREVVEALARRVQERGATVMLNARVIAVHHNAREVVIETTAGEVRTDYLVNCAGLYADAVARLSGASPMVRIIPFRGEYYLLRPERQHLVRGLIYPVPDPRFPFLGVHFTRKVTGEVEAGPNAVLALAREGYRLWQIRAAELVEMLTYRGFWVMTRRYWLTGFGEFYRSLVKLAFVRAVQRLVPEVQSRDLTKGGAGVRAQAVTTEGVLIDDFYIEQDRWAIHVLNAPSPAATASIVIGEHIASLAQEAWSLPR